MDGRTIRIIAFCFIFLGTFVTILALIPNEFAVSTKQYSSIEEGVPPEWNGIDLINYNLTAATPFRLNNTNQHVYFDVGGRNLKLKTVSSVFGGNTLYLMHCYGFGLIWEEAMDWYNQLGIVRSTHDFGGYVYISAEAITEDYSSHGDIQYDVKCLGLGGGSSKFQVIALMYFNSSLHTDPYDAWENSALELLIGIEFKYAASTMDAWYLITSLLTFNTVEVFGSSGAEAIAMNLILALPFFACILIPAALFLLEVIDRLTPL